jgi:hypothetical protein
VREKSNFVKRIKAVVTFKFGAQKYLSFVFSENDVCFSAFRADEGAYASSRTWCGMRWTGWCREMSGTGADGEVVWSWRPKVRRQVLAKLTGFAKATVANGMVHRGEHV